MRRRIPTVITNVQHDNPQGFNKAADGKVSVLPDVVTERFIPRKDVHLPDGYVPLVDADTAPIQEVWTSRNKVFKLDDDVEAEATNQIWQRISDEKAKYCEHKFFQDTAGAPRLYLRWIDLSYKVN